jgi:hypothetical protein
LDRRLGGPQSRFGRGGKEKNSQPLPGLEPPITSPVAQRYTTELFRILMCTVETRNAYKILFEKPEVVVDGKKISEMDIKMM